MSGAKHTPGPWEVGGLPWEWSVDTDSSNVAAAVGPTDDRPVAVVVVEGLGKGADMQVDANAALIAAAPDLLEACEAAQEALSALDRVQMYGSADMVRDRAARALTRIESAIAKAKGETP